MNDFLHRHKNKININLLLQFNLYISIFQTQKMLVFLKYIIFSIASFFLFESKEYIKSIINRINLI